MVREGVCEKETIIFVTYMPHMNIFSQPIPLIFNSYEKQHDDDLRSGRDCFSKDGCRQLQTRQPQSIRPFPLYPPPQWQTMR